MYPNLGYSEEEKRRALQSAIHLYSAARRKIEASASVCLLDQIAGEALEYQISALEALRSTGNDAAFHTSIDVQIGKFNTQRDAKVRNFLDHVDAQKVIFEEAQRELLELSPKVPDDDITYWVWALNSARTVPDKNVRQPENALGGRRRPPNPDRPPRRRIRDPQGPITPRELRENVPPLRTTPSDRYRDFGAIASLDGIGPLSDQLLDAPIEWVRDHAETSEPANPNPPSESIEVFAQALTLLRAQTDNIAAAAFDAYVDSMEHAVETGHFSAKGIGKSMRASAKQSLLSIGQQASVKGAFEVAEGVSSYADHDSTGGGKHMAAAGKWFAVAGLAGAGAAAIGGGEGGGGAKERKRDEVAPNGADPEGKGSGKGRVIQRITVIGNPTDGQAAEIKGKLAAGARGRAHN